MLHPQLSSEAVEKPNSESFRPPDF